MSHSGNTRLENGKMQYFFVLTQTTRTQNGNTIDDRIDQVMALNKKNSEIVMLLKYGFLWCCFALSGVACSFFSCLGI